MDAALITRYLKEHLSDKRFLHSLRVADTCKGLAQRYKADGEKAYIAALAHDCAREQDKTRLLELAAETGMLSEPVEFQTKELLHGLAAITICKAEFRIRDTDILNSVRYHTTGRGKMTLLEKLVFLADFIEPSRSFEGVDHIRKLACEDLDGAMIKALDSSILFIMGKSALIHPATIEARNDLIKRRNESNAKTDF